jgi:hypothetical protein
VTPAPAPRRWAVVGAWLARLVLAGVFLAAAAPKIADPPAFAAAIANYRLFPDAAVNLIATVVPALELVGALALLTPGAAAAPSCSAACCSPSPRCSPSASPAASTSAAAASAARAPAVEPVSPLHLLRNVGLLVLGALLLAAPARTCASPPPPRRGGVVDRRR